MTKEKFFAELGIDNPSEKQYRVWLHVQYLENIETERDILISRMRSALVQFALRELTPPSE